MPRIGGFDRISAGAHLDDQIDDLFERRIRQMRDMPTAEAHVIADAVLGNTAERMIERVDSELRPLAIAFGAPLNQMIVHVGEYSVVHLKKQARVVDLQIFLAQRFSQSKDV